VDGKRIKAANQFVMIKLGKEQQCGLMGSPDLEAMILNKARKQAGFSAGLLEMGWALTRRSWSSWPIAATKLSSS
jgi:hypothetical protein